MAFVQADCEGGGGSILYDEGCNTRSKLGFYFKTKVECVAGVLSSYDMLELILREEAQPVNEHPSWSGGCCGDCPLFAGSSAGRGL